MHKSMRIAAGLAALSMIVAACGDDDGDSGASSSGASESGGAGGKTLIVSVDLPFQGASADASNATSSAIKLYLEQVEHKAGDYNVELKEYDDSTAAKGAWDDATCTKNAQDHVAEHRRGRRHGHLQLRLRQARGADPQPGPRRPDADGVARQHQPRPDQGLGPGRAGEVTTRPASATTPAS